MRVEALKMKFIPERETERERECVCCVCVHACISDCCWTVGAVLKVMYQLVAFQKFDIY